MFGRRMYGDFKRGFVLSASDHAEVVGDTEEDRVAAQEYVRDALSPPKPDAQLLEDARKALGTISAQQFFETHSLEY